MPVRGLIQINLILDSERHFGMQAEISHASPSNEQTKTVTRLQISSCAVTAKGEV